MIIKDIKAREILDSRGIPTVEAEVITDGGNFISSVPSGASTGIFEALELRDNDEKYMHGKGVKQAVRNIVTEIKDLLLGKNVNDQYAIDKAMVDLDGTTNIWGFPKKRLGANSILAVSISICRAAAHAENIPLYRYIANITGNNEKKLRLPMPYLNVINGGVHAGNRLAMQEFMIVPVGATTFKEAMVMGSEVYHTLKNTLKAKFGAASVNIGDEGGFAPNVDTAEEALDLLLEAIDKTGLKDKVKIAMDPAASEFYDADSHCYDLNFKNPDKKKDLLNNMEFLEYYKRLIEKYPIISIEDCFEQDDHDGFEALTNEIGDKVQIVGDDLLVTNVKRIEMALKRKECNALLLKMNQIGTISEAIESYRLAATNNWGVMVSHRSGDTEDTFIADLAVGLSTGQLKCGAPCRGERTAKYNRLIRIEEELGENGYIDSSAFRS